ncbi:MAG: FKBP-type peptidyl-prolyl cis-trans isomerase [Neisseria sp.]|uniref:FKBP-type peptidyl-prolyl cis-trans isomerase n=1 Tax=Neisseria sp. TaxID=192066 RepID=UPI0026DC0EF4|nr:FKBP-type peptidyl-prolyl cis-trans isomerase [Neisseria sp.]MDO4248965.1 FKBP-type peptidyl-prolyl cis-trans isomerase [Neisseria sp.]
MKPTLKAGLIVLTAAFSLAACKQEVKNASASGASAATSSSAPANTAIAGLETPAKQTGYAFGAQIAQQMITPWKSQGIAIDSALVLENMKKVADGGQPSVTPDEARKFMGELAKSMQGAASDAAPKLTPEQSKTLSILMGAQMGNAAFGVKNNGLSFDLDAFAQGISDIADGKATKMTPEQMDAAIKQAEQAHADAAANSPEAKANLEKGQAFLKENANKEGVKTTASGLQYKITKEGSGKQPQATDEVTVDYTGKLIDGTEFDSGKNISFPLNGVIPGWTEGLQLMKEGGEATFYIPAELAYGKQQAGEKILPNSTLVFDVKLVKVGK